MKETKIKEKLGRKKEIPNMNKAIAKNSNEARNEYIMKE